MMAAKLAVATLIINVANGPSMEPSGSRLQELSLPQKNIVMQPYLDSVTKCIARTVAVERRGHQEREPANLGDLIVASIPACIGQVGALIKAYDRTFGKGAGEAFFMGPYLDILPVAVTRINRWDGAPTSQR